METSHIIAGPLYKYLEDAPGWDDSLLMGGFLALEESHFNCDVLSNICAAGMGCQSVDEDFVHEEIIHADCAIQTSLICCSLFCVVMAVHVLCANVMLETIFAGCRRILWRRHVLIGKVLVALGVAMTVGWFYLILRIRFLSQNF